MKKKVKVQTGNLTKITEMDIQALMQRMSITRDDAMRRLLNRAVRQ